MTKGFVLAAAGAAALAGIATAAMYFIRKRQKDRIKFI